MAPDGTRSNCWTVTIGALYLAQNLKYSIVYIRQRKLFRLLTF